MFCYFKAEPELVLGSVPPSKLTISWSWLELVQPALNLTVGGQLWGTEHKDVSIEFGSVLGFALYIIPCSSFRNLRGVPHVFVNHEPTYSLLVDTSCQMKRF